MMTAPSKFEQDLPQLLRGMAGRLMDRGETELDPYLLTDAAFVIEELRKQLGDQHDRLVKPAREGEWRIPTEKIVQRVREFFHRTKG